MTAEIVIGFDADVIVLIGSILPKVGSLTTSTGSSRSFSAERFTGDCRAVHSTDCHRLGTGVPQDSCSTGMRIITVTISLSAATCETTALASVINRLHIPRNVILATDLNYTVYVSYL
jgi:hypothetical protein